MSVPADRQDPAIPVSATAGGLRVCRVLPLALLVAAAVTILAMGWHRALSLESLVRHREEIDAFVTTNRAAALAAFGAIYVAAVALSLPGAVFLTISGGLVFGTFAGAAVAVVAATAGATLLFLVARSAIGGWMVRRVGPLAERLAENFRRDAFSYILFLRLVPIFPFWIVNLVPALCGACLMPFVAATAIGVIPATIAFAFLGSGLDSAIASQAAAYKACLAAGQPDCHLDFDLKAAATPELLAALAALSLFALVPIVLKRLKRFPGRPH
jgi:uncharacterized membrane protein YdjX (TVP38/TMEM64 family)